MTVCPSWPLLRNFFALFRDADSPFLIDSNCHCVEDSGGHLRTLALAIAELRECPMRPEPIRARLIDDNTIASGGVRLVALDPIKSMCQRLVADGYDPAASLQIWKGTKPWRLVFSIGQPDHQVQLKAKRSEP